MSVQLEGSKASWELSLGEFLVGAVDRNPGKVFLEIAGQQITYGELYARVKQAAAVFAGLGVSRGDRVCLFLPNVPEFHYCWFGLSLLGAISVPVNVAYKRDEAAYIFNNAGAKVVVAHRSLQDVAEAAAAVSSAVAHKLLVTTTLDSEAGLPQMWTPESIQAAGWTSAPQSPQPRNWQVFPRYRPTKPPCWYTPRVPPETPRGCRLPT